MQISSSSGVTEALCGRLPHGIDQTILDWYFSGKGQKFNCVRY